MPSIRRNRKYYGKSEMQVWPADFPKVQHPRAKKDTKRWCLGIVGREHESTVVRKWPMKCGPWSWDSKGRWHCNHAIKCVKCGKETGFFDESICPDKK